MLYGGDIDKEDCFMEWKGGRKSLLTARVISRQDTNPKPRKIVRIPEKLKAPRSI